MSETLFEIEEQGVRYIPETGFTAEEVRQRAEKLVALSEGTGLINKVQTFIAARRFNQSHTRTMGYYDHDEAGYDFSQLVFGVDAAKRVLEHVIIQE